MDLIQKTASALEREVSQVKASFKTADKEALILRERVEEAEKKLKDILEHLGRWTNLIVISYAAF